MEQREVKEEIECMKEKLDRLIENGAEFEKIYETSRQLDKLIVTFLKVRIGTGTN